ncbi:helix-turn-helix domain-containing protein [Lacipirellula limnantheis]|uniref:Helix-turn-helix domain protein n=1 Tax=Lacipirellula limnantheis TaxID=2528024 RepID=A0A517TTI3_9BACT|nr:Helix-turn-helix domain protein [Lacipirellula limnantheis]
MAVKITSDEIRELLQGSEYPPILRADEAAELLRVPLKTLYVWVASGRLSRCFTKQGKRLLFSRDRLVHAIFNGKEK